CSARQRPRLTAKAPYDWEQPIGEEVLTPGTPRHPGGPEPDARPSEPPRFVLSTKRGLRPEYPQVTPGSRLPMAHGRHIKVLGRGSPALLGDASNVKKTLEDLVDLLGMRLLGQPHMYEVECEIEKMGVEPFEDEGGVTGVCVLST